MRMDPTDVSDVTGSVYTFLINGHGPDDNWTALFNPGERVRLRFINAAAMTIFNVRIPGLSMKVVQADGLNVKPVDVEEFQISVAETYDVVVQPTEDKAFTLVAEAVDRSGMGRATLAPRPGMAAEFDNLCLKAAPRALIGSQGLLFLPINFSSVIQRTTRESYVEVLEALPQRDRPRLAAAVYDVPRSPSFTAIRQLPIVAKGARVKRGEVLADSAATPKK